MSTRNTSHVSWAMCFVDIFVYIESHRAGEKHSTPTLPSTITT